MLGVFAGLGEGDLVGAEGAFDLLPIDDLRAGPALRGGEDDDGPFRACGVVVLAGFVLDAVDFGENFVEGVGHEGMHLGGIIAFDEVRIPPAAVKELFELFARDACEDGGVGNLVAVEVEDGEDGAIGDGIEELVGVPGGGEGSGFGFTIADDAGDDQVGIVEDGAEGMREGVAEFAALVDGAGGFGGDVGGDSAGEGELAEEFFHSGFVLRDGGVELGVGAFEVGVGDEAGTAVAGAGDVDHVEVVLLDDAIEVDVDEILAGGGAPVAEEAFFDILEFEGLFEERVVVEVDLANGEIVGGAPVGVDFFEHFRGERFGHVCTSFVLLSGEGGRKHEEHKDTKDHKDGFNPEDPEDGERISSSSLCPLCSLWFIPYCACDSWVFLSQKAGDGLGDDEFFICWDDPHFDAALFGGD